MINDLLNGRSINTDNIVNIKFSESNKWHSFIYKYACIRAKKILNEQEFKKAQIRGDIVEMFELIYSAFETENKEAYVKFENAIKRVNSDFEELKGKNESVLTVAKVEEEQQANTLNDIQVNQKEIITQVESIEEVSLAIQSNFTKVSSKKLPKELLRLKKDSK